MMGKQYPEKSNNNIPKKELDPAKQNQMDRRHFLRTSAAGLAGAGIVSAFPFMSLTSKSMGYPYTLGVASGDPLPHGVVLWTRLAPKPLQGGGMSSDPVDVRWEVAEDQGFTRIVKKGEVTAGPKYGHSVHVEVDGLESNHGYYYRFKTGNQTSPAGRTKTAPAYDENIDQLNFAFASCQNYPAGYYTAYDHMVEEDLDVVFFLGDYIYEKDGKGSLGRTHLPQKEIKTLQDYRIRYGQYKSDPSLQAAHAAFPWIVTPDDHEVKNNWGGEGPPYHDNEDFLARRAIAFQAYYEHMPLRKEAIPDNTFMQLHRGFSYGNLVDFNVLDTRQFRTDFACNGEKKVQCDERLDPSRTILGGQQETWLFNRLKQSSARWNILPQQVMMAQWDRLEGPGKAFSMDKWDGYAATRKRLFDTIKKHDVDNFIVLTGDSHKNWVNNLLEDFGRPQSPILGTEFMGTSISSSGDGTAMSEKGQQALADNPFIKFFNQQRGYVRCTLTPQKMQADFRVLPYVTKPGAPIKTRASFLVNSGQPGAMQV